MENITCLVVSFLLQTLSICNKAEQRKNIYPPYQEGPHVSHHILHVHSALSPSRWLFWFDGCNLIRSASIHGWFMSLSLCSGAEKHMEAVSRLFFSPRLFKSTLQHAPLWPLMHPVHLAEQRCETQDHRHGQKQFHPLSEPIFTEQFEEKQESDMFYCICLACKLCILSSVIPTLVTCPSISVYCSVSYLIISPWWVLNTQTWEETLLKIVKEWKLP